MPTDQSARAQAVYDALIQQNPKSAQMSASEKQQVRAGVQAVFAADLAYLVANVTVKPSTMNAAAGASVQVAPASGSGSVTSPSLITGSGSII